MIGKKESFLKETSEDRPMKKEGRNALPGISSLTRKELKEFEGKCVAVVDGKAVFAHKDASRVLDELEKFNSKDKVFTCIPRGNITLVK